MFDHLESTMLACRSLRRLAGIILREVNFGNTFEIKRLFKLLDLGDGGELQTEEVTNGAIVVDHSSLDGFLEVHLSFVVWENTKDLISLRVQRVVEHFENSFVSSVESFSSELKVVKNGGELDAGVVLKLLHERNCVEIGCQHSFQIPSVSVVFSQEAEYLRVHSRHIRNFGVA